MIITYNICNLSDTTKLNQLLETINNYNIDFFELTKTYYPKGIKFKTLTNPTYIAFWSTYINRHAGVGIILYRK